MYVCILTYIHTYVYTYIHIHIHIHIHTYIQPPWVKISPYEPYLRSHIEESAKLQAGKSTKSPARSRSSSIAPPSRRMAVRVLF